MGSGPCSSKGTVDIRNCPGINQCISSATRPVLILTWGSQAPFPLGKDLAQFSESPLKLTFPLQWRHLVVNKGDAMGSQPPTSQGSCWREISPPRNPGLPGALTSNWQDLAFPFPAALHSSPPTPILWLLRKLGPPPLTQDPQDPPWLQGLCPPLNLPRTSSPKVL